MRWPPWLSQKPTVSLDEIRRSFNEAAADEEHFPSTIDPRIYHVQLILEYFGDLRTGRALDVGCGKGRFARILKERNPDALVAGLDLAEAMLRFVPKEIAPCSASIHEASHLVSPA